MQQILTKETTESRVSGGISVELMIRRAIENDNPVAIYDELVPLLAMLSPGEYAAAKTELREHFKRRLSIADLEKAIRACRKGQKRAKIASQGTRSVVQVGGQLRDVVHAALNALAEANKENPEIFVDQSGRLVRVNYSTKGVPSITPLTLSSLRYHMSLSADYVAIRETVDDTVALATDPPLDVVRILLEMNPAQYPFPPLAGITELPIMRTDGSIYQTPGYDAVTEQVYVPGNLRIPEIPETPSQADVAAALAKLDYWLADFPFADNASKAAALANVITAVIRPVIAGQVPLTLLDAPKQGSGKTILAQGIGIVATGRVVPTNAPTCDEEEQRKKILTWLQTSPALVIMDNVIHVLESSSLNSALTSPYVEDRELGSNTLLRVENRAIWFASGNNIKVGDDTARRCIKCRLDAKMENPHKRDISKFRIAGGVRGFFAWTIEHRAELVTACLILARNWYAQGKPKADVLPIGSFEDWTITIGGILQAAGVSDFLANMNDATGENSVDDVTAEWKAFIETVHIIYQDKPFTCFDLAKRLLDEDEPGQDLRETLPGALTKNLDSYLRSKGQDRSLPEHMGKAFGRKLGAYFGDLCLHYAPEKYDRKHKTQWQITTEQVEAPSHQEPQEPASRYVQTAKKLVKWIEDKGGQLSYSLADGKVLLQLPGYTGEQWQKVYNQLQDVAGHVYRLKQWPLVQHEVL